MAERILVVEDDDTTRKLIVSMLSSANYDCREAGDGLEALAVLDSGAEFELVVSNLMMPGLDGIGLLERLKEKYSDIPVVMESGVTDVTEVIAAFRNGAQDYLLKPFKREQLLAMVRRALDRQRLKIEQREH